ncbi:6-hydroxycyclohex-1-ene-1-carbonyl-CoA dehydrogenase [Magnetospirillum moscoviense]|uniref:6-hydroxycyclohex-1-ene-1-carbonyl-CoA dehydrogenase n=1 Tax=Magnetospirillum moscoviense TaxID=1437059 RepID=A0A178MSH8_9PROT|nr:6-hydroxycyclohex-1-ene-1-carbonyl-CoA dehydrogenase [Magnetospirillum moscoviense]MBF0324974.1 6-hydroxycyclohex-1-ene-1-carbonyl-CoA dehydrogenase [Alphaproteobacteria bacterium]OAN52803.1 6-hydroxycyclohex-1-ene-1-carbonyl-CoA dehydrogenase [Magnetospirillum moscoviense]
MANSPYRWMMTALGAPMVKEPMDVGTLEPGDVLVAIAGCGVCHTDLDYYYNGVRTNHPLPLTLGHEISGRVEKAGAGAEGWLGKAVIIPAVIPCGECDLCKRGKGTICRSQKMPGNDFMGGFATHIKVPAKGLCPVDEARLAAIGMELAEVAVVADALTTPYQSAIQAGIGQGDLVIVIGAGGVGGYSVQVANALGAKVVALDIDDKKLEQVAAYGAALTLNPKNFPGTREIKKEISAFAKAQGLRATEWIIMECSGSVPGQQTAFDLMVHGCTLCVVGYTFNKAEFRLSNLMAYHARALGNWGCVPELYPGALELVLSGKVNVKNFVERHPLDAINEIFTAAHDHKLIRRAVLVPAV